MRERKKDELANLSPLPVKPRQEPAPPPPFPEPDRTAKKRPNDLPGTPRWKKVLGALFRASAIAAPSAGVGYVAAEVQLMQQTQPQPPAPASAFEIQADAGKVLESANIDKLVPLLVVIVPDENTEPKRAETKSVLAEGCEFVKSLPGELFKDALKDAIGGIAVGAPLLALAGFLKRRAKETGNKSIEWTSEAAEQIADLFGKKPVSAVITTLELNDVFGDKALAAETLLVMLGYKKQADEWRRADGSRRHFSWEKGR